MQYSFRLRLFYRAASIGHGMNVQYALYQLFQTHGVILLSGNNLANASGWEISQDGSASVPAELLSKEVTDLCSRLELTYFRVTVV